MPPNNNPKSKASFVMRLQLIGENFNQTLKSITGSAKNLSDRLNEVGSSASEAYDQKLFNQIEDAVEQFESLRSEANRRWEEIQQDLDNLEIFPNLRKSVDEAYSTAQQRLNVAKKARMSGIINSQDLTQIEHNANLVKDATLSVTEAAQKLAKLSAKADLDDVSQRVSVELARKDLSDREKSLREAEANLRKSTNFTIASQQALEEVSQRVLANGSSAFGESFREGLDDFKNGFSLIWQGKFEEGKSYLTRAVGTSRALQTKRKEILSKDSDGSLSAVEKTLIAASTAFSSMVSGVSRLSMFAAAGISLLGGFVAVMRFLIQASDSARQLNKDLLEGRSLADFGLSLQAVTDENSIKDFMDSVQSLYQSEFTSENPFLLSRDDFLKAREPFKDLNLARAAGALSSTEERMKTLNNFANFGIVARREWADSSNSLAQMSVDLVNEFGATEQYVKGVAGGLDRVAKQTTLSVPRLLGSVQGLADQSPIFGDNIITSATLFADLYKTGTLGTKDIKDYMQMLVGTFQSEDTAQRMAAYFATQKPAEFISIIQKAIDSIDPEGPKKRLRSLLQEGLGKFESAAKSGRAMTATEVLELSTMLSELVKGVPQAAQALIGVGLLDESTLNAKATDADFGKKLQLTVANIERFSVFTGDKEGAVKFMNAIRSLALLDRNKNKTIRQLLDEAMTSVKDSTKEDLDAYEAIRKRLEKHAPNMAQAAQGLVNSVQGFLMQMSRVANDLVTGLQGFLATPVMKKIADIIGISLPEISPSGESRAIFVPSPDINSTIESLRKIRDQMAKKKTRDPSLIRQFHAGLRKLVEQSAADPNAFQYATRGQPLGMGDYRTKSGIDLSAAIPGASAETLQAIDNFLRSKPTVAPSSTLPPAIPTPLSDLPRRVQQALDRKTFKVGKVDVSIPRNIINLSQTQKDILNQILSDRNDSRKLVIQALHTRYGNTPIFAYMLQHVLKAVEKNRNISASSLSGHAIEQLNVLSQGKVYNVHSDYSLLPVSSVQIQDYLQDTTNSAIQEVRRDLNQIRLDTRNPKPVNVKPTDVKETREPNRPLAQQPPQPASGQSPPPPAPTVAKVPEQGAIQYTVKSIQMQIFDTKVDVAAVANQAIADRLAELSARTTNQKKTDSSKPQ